MFHVKHEGTMKTPYLYLDQNQLIHNIREMSELAKANGTILRPHCKSHKTLEIARLQMKAGAAGITASTLKEARMLLEGGIPSVTLAYPLVEREKMMEYQELCRLGELRTLALDAEHGTWLNAQASREHPLSVYLKVDTGLNRLGVKPERIETETAALLGLPNLRLIGLLTHGGHSYKGLRPLREVAEEEAYGLLLHNPDGLVVSCGSTPTARELLRIQGIDELRPGNYVFYDRTMVALGVAVPEAGSLRIRTTVLACYEDHVVIDAGSKALSSDAGVHGNANLPGYGLVIENRKLVIERLSEEHGILRGPGMETLKPGVRLTILPNHACAAVNLFDQMEVFRDGEHVDTYKIRGRGH